MVFEDLYNFAAYTIHNNKNIICTDHSTDIIHTDQGISAQGG